MEITGGYKNSSVLVGDWPLSCDDVANRPVVVFDGYKCFKIAEKLFYCNTVYEYI